MTDKVVAYTKFDSVYPGYLNVTEKPDGSAVLHVRADPEKRKGVYICGRASDKGHPGRCTPGDDNCNNYCNMAPEKGPMQKSAKECEQVLCGQTVSLELSADEWAKVKKDLQS